MTTIRDQMLERIRAAVAAGNRAGGSPALPERGNIGYQGAGDDPVARFCQELAAAGGQAHRVADAAEARRAILDMVQSRSIRRVLLGQGDVLDALQLAEPLRAASVEVVAVGSAQAADRATLFGAELGISGVGYLIAETGSVIVASQPNQPRSLSLLPPLHIAVAGRWQILPDLFDLFTRLGNNLDELSACLTIITGPSKTGDIELRLVTGVHGPGEIHVLLLDALGQ
jgi:L-lactate dehydrogenase complex protein LldG